MDTLISVIVERWDEVSPVTADRIAARARLVATAPVARGGRTSAIGLVPVVGTSDATGSRADLEAALGVLAAPPAVVELSGVRVKGADLVNWLTPDLVVAAEALGIADRRSRTTACRVLTGIIGVRWPGHTIEVRVPPAAAVQCGLPGDGPQHTRGTPPNVVETDPVTFVALGVGALSWADARASHRVRASGNRSNLGWMFPLL